MHCAETRRVPKAGLRCDTMRDELACRVHGRARWATRLRRDVHGGGSGGSVAAGGAVAAGATLAAAMRVIKGRMLEETGASAATAV